MAAFYPTQQARELLSPGQPSQGYSQPIKSRKYYPMARDFLFFSVVVLMFAVFDLLWPRWVSYCGLNAGLTSYSEGLRQSNEYWNILDGCLSYSSTECGDPCTNTQRFEAAGIIMIICGISSILLTLVATVYMIVFLFRPEFSRKRAFSVILVSGAGFWMLATVIYLIIFLIIENGASDTQVQEGLGIAFGIAIIYIGLAVQSIRVLDAFS